ncbi:MAG: AraC family transcriptional regulator [Crocinitomicaceae bacterium]|nr:AraC family transcriptional regulator [Crocinitomicaceae bacterium]
MNYKTYPFNRELNAFVKCFWTLESPSKNKPEKQRIIPDGCMEMIFHYGDLYKQYLEDGSFVIQPKCFVFGQVTLPLDIEPTGETGIFSVRFHPDGFTPFSTIDINEMVNTTTTLPKLFGDEGLLLEKSILSAKANEDRVKIIETFLLERLIDPEVADRIAKSSLEILMRLNGQISVTELSDELQINRKQLQRRLTSVIGLSPKQLSKIIRLQATLKMLEDDQSTNLTSVAYDGGYFDQAHFIKDFKEFTGVSPKQFYADNLKMSVLFMSTD